MFSPDEFEEIAKRLADELDQMTLEEIIAGKWLHGIPDEQTKGVEEEVRKDGKPRTIIRSR